MNHPFPTNGRFRLPHNGRFRLPLYRTSSLPHWRLVVITVLALLLLLVPSLAHAQAEVPAGDGAKPTRYLVGLNAALPAAQVAAASADAAAQPLATLDPCTDAQAVAASDAGAAAPSVQVWQAPPGGEQAMLDWLRQQPQVAFVEPEATVYAAQDSVGDGAAGLAPAAAVTETAFAVNDPLYASQQWAPQRANFARAWQLITDANLTLTPIRVAVIDSGVDFTHPDLARRLLPGKNYLSATDPPNDENGHGTHVAGIIAAIINNNQGIAGTAMSVLIDPRKVLNANGSGGISDLYTAICESARDGARIISMSLQIPQSSMAPTSQNYILLKRAVDFAASKGVLLVAAGGNNASTHELYYPAMFDNVLAVAASTSDNVPAAYSPIAAKVGIIAPGGDSKNPVLSTWPSASTVRSRCLSINRPLVENNGAWYCGEAGTSMAAPMVVGEAALLMSIRPTLTATQTQSTMLNTAVDLGLPATQQGAGLINAEAAVRLIMQSDMTVAPNLISQVIGPGAEPFTTTVTISNPSNDVLTVTGVVSPTAWFTVTNVAAPFSATVQYGKPLFLSVVISPTYLANGNYLGRISLTGTRADGTQVRQAVIVNVVVGNFPYRRFLPKIMRGVAMRSSSPGVTPVAWETPISPTVYAFTTTTSAEVDLPFAFPLSGPSQASPPTADHATIYANGYLALSNTSNGVGQGDNEPPAANRCMAYADAADQSVFGWWANLDATAPGAEVSSFQPAPDRFAIQYSNVPSAVDVTPPYTVTFQVVLNQNGNIQLNYRDVPTFFASQPQVGGPSVTIGTQAQNGLFSNQITCFSAGQTFGALPTAGQSLLIPATSVY